jgi:hypothetical protein
MFVYSSVLAKQKLLWLKMWSEFVVFRKAKNSPSLGFMTPNSTMVAQGNLPALGILFLDDHFFFIFSQRCSFLFHSCSCSLRYLAQAFQCNSLQKKFGCEKGLGYDLFLFIYTTVEDGDMGELLFWEFKLKDGI